MYEASLQLLFNILLIADKKRKTSKYFVVIFIFNLLSLVSENYLPYYAFETSLELNQTESVRMTQFITRFLFLVNLFEIYQRLFLSALFIVRNKNKT